MFRKIKMQFQRGKNGYCEEDLWNISDWFLKLIPEMLEKFNEDRFGYPVGMSDKEWDKIIKRMIFCFTEGKEETCTKKNKYTDEWIRVHDEFEKQYGLFGEKLPQEEKEHVKLYFPDSDEIGNKEWKAVIAKWNKEETKLYKYREKMVDEGLSLFKEYFWKLWD